MMPVPESRQDDPAFDAGGASAMLGRGVLAAALTQLMSSAQPPLRWPAGADAVSALEQKAKTLP